MTDYHHNNQYYWHLTEVTSIKSNYRMIVCWLLLIITSHLTDLRHVNIECTKLFQRSGWGNDRVNITLRVSQNFTLAVFIAFSVVPSLEVAHKMESRKKGEGRGH